jgi:hypothetical protein
MISENSSRSRAGKTTQRPQRRCRPDARGHAPRGPDQQVRDGLVQDESRQSQNPPLQIPPPFRHGLGFDNRV